jgi:hypothetical protein
MSIKVGFNDAWESIPLEFADDVLKFFDTKLQPNHPLRACELSPLAKRWRKRRYLVEELKSRDLLWVLDFDRRMRIKGKTFCYFKRIETQEEFDALLKADHDEWVQEMKDAGAWYGAPACQPSLLPRR